MARKVLVIISRFVPAPGGAQRYVYELARGLSSMKYLVLVLSTDYWLVGPGVSRRIPPPQMFSHDVSSPFSIVRLSPRAIRGYPITFGTSCTNYVREASVVHIHESLDGIPFYFPAILAARISRKRIVITLHIIFQNRQNPLSQIANFAGGLMLNLCDSVAVLSKADFNYLSKLPIALGKVVVMPPGIEAPNTWGNRDRAPPRASKGRLMILTVASLTKIKGIDDSIRAMSILSKQFDLQYLVVGPDLGYGKVLKDLTSVLGLEARVSFLGQIDNREELKQIYLEADIVVIPSKHETSPVTLLESMASGKPIVATRVGNIPEIIENGETGILVEPSSPKALADAIGNLISNEQLRKSLALRAKKIVQKYDMKIVAEGYSRLYGPQ